MIAAIEPIAATTAKTIKAMPKIRQRVTVAVPGKITRIRPRIRVIAAIKMELPLLGFNMFFIRFSFAEKINKMAASQKDAAIKIPCRHTDLSLCENFVRIR